MSSQQNKPLTSTAEQPLVNKTDASSPNINAEVMNELEKSLVNGDVRALIQAVNIELEKNMQKLGEQLECARSKLRSSSS